MWSVFMNHKTTDTIARKILFVYFVCFVVRKKIPAC